MMLFTKFNINGLKTFQRETIENLLEKTDVYLLVMIVGGKNLH